MFTTPTCTHMYMYPHVHVHVLHCSRITCTCTCALQYALRGFQRYFLSGQVRNHKGRKTSSYAPEEGNRYDGIYKVVRYWPQRSSAGFIVWKYLLRRDDLVSGWVSQLYMLCVYMYTCTCMCVCEVRVDSSMCMYINEKFMFDGCCILF